MQSACYIIGGVLAGVLLGGLAGLGLGILLARGYTKHGPSDIADGPAYVAIGLIFFGGVFGGLLGFIAGIIMLLLNWAGRLDKDSYQKRIHQLH
jgi:hypothetical protein